MTLGQPSICAKMGVKMLQITNSFSKMGLARLKREVDLCALVGALIRLKKVGRQFMGCCPFHDDQNPSLVVTPGQNLWCCLGCQRGGTIIDWVMYSENVSLREAFAILAQRYPQFIEPAEGKPRRQAKSTLVSQPRANRPPEEKPTIPQPQETIEQAIGYYNFELQSNNLAKKYLANRGITDRAIEEFNIGFCKNAAAKTLKRRRHDPEGTQKLITELSQSGLLVKKDQSFYERFYNSIVIPIYDDQGNITEVYGRKVILKPRQRAHQYLPGKHIGFFNYKHLVTHKPEHIILCESIFDALTFWVNGLCNVTASFGVSGFTDDLRSFISSTATKVYIAYDNDKAGNAAAEKLQQELTSYGIRCLRINFKKGQDANQVIIPSKTPRSDLVRLMARATEMKQPNAA